MSSKNQIQLYADECFPIPSVTYLKSLGYSVIHAFDKKNIGKKDSFHLSESKRLKRVLITLDRDFLYYPDADLKAHPGVIVISATSVTFPMINKVCNKALKYISDKYVRHSILTVTFDRITKIKEGIRVEKMI